MVIDENLVPFLEEMLYELMENRLEVELVPSNNPDHSARKIRASISNNIDWYQDHCANYLRPKRRKKGGDTIINKSDTVKLIGWMIKNKKSRSKYAPDILQVAQDRYEIIKKYETEEIPWNNQF